MRKRSAIVTCAAVACAFAIAPRVLARGRRLSSAGESAQADGKWHPFQPKPGSDQPDNGAAQSPNQGPVIRSQTNLVSILTSVMDKGGKPVLGLPQSAFSLSEEGAPQKIERFEAQTTRPVDLALMIDASASTYRDLKFELDAAAHFIR